MKKALLFLCQGLEEYEACVFTDALGWTTTYGLEPIELITTGFHSRIQCAWNFTIEPERAFNDIDVDEFDALLIPGGMSRAGFYDDAFDERLLELIRAFDSRNKLIASVCVGALPIAQSGVLKGRTATTYQLSEKRQNQMRELGVQVLQQPLVIDDNIITSTSPATAMEVAFTVVETLTSSDNLERIKRGMGFTTP
ncbi:4-methyl-5(b-hydroxyethyl)-thiazole monophosphate biosynthesis [Ferrimonas sediminum]|uniref:4-methyl-5(B-hydroxyethyl)-thiazole monophosphate biosynthesis n=1 Tax=Ferrimonas sediminum TaxID=718193 RepID=A0A1G8X4Q3_9GAMM|nr:DJ-1/PfpI family protein [Ferrimonas sediminum]SDJ84795.1 4-methyl-5(b-hydroxyethyl)-thiazole monophosphate biosynthesis [Ferrimonas sediminum]